MGLYTVPVDKVALELTCPRCQRGKGQRCIYTVPSFYEKYEVGDETLVPHAERRAAARQLLDARLRRQQLAGRAGEITPARQRQRDIVAAHRAFDLAEWEQMRNWLREYGEILLAAAVRRPDEARIRALTDQLRGRD